MGYGMDEKILVAEDEKEIADLVALYLENEGFQEIMREYEIQVEGEQVWVGR